MQVIYTYKEYSLCQLFAASMFCNWTQLFVLGCIIRALVWQWLFLGEVCLQQLGQAATCSQLYTVYCRIRYIIYIYILIYIIILYNLITSINVVHISRVLKGSYGILLSFVTFRHYIFSGLTHPTSRWSWGAELVSQHRSWTFEKSLGHLSHGI